MKKFKNLKYIILISLSLLAKNLFGIENYSIDYQLIKNANLDEWFYKLSLKNRQKVKKGLENIVVKFIKHEMKDTNKDTNLKNAFRKLPNNYFKKVILNKIAYLEYEKRLFPNATELKITIETILNFLDNASKKTLFLGQYEKRFYLVGPITLRGNISCNTFCKQVTMNKSDQELIIEILKEKGITNNIKRLVFHKKSTAQLPENVSYLINVEKVCFKKNLIEEIPIELFEFKKIQSIDLSKNNIKKPLLENVTFPVNLEKIDLTDCTYASRIIKNSIFNQLKAANFKRLKTSDSSVIYVRN